MKKILLMLFVLAFVGSTYAAIPVKFSVNMNVKITEGTFEVGVSKIVMRGSFQTAAGDAADWSGTFFELMDTDADGIYTITVNFPDDKAGTEYEYKFVNIGTSDGWEGVDNRKFTVTAPNMDMPVVYFDNDEVVDTTADNTVTFQADLTNIAGTGVGFFDSATDQMTIQGIAGWDSDGSVIVSGNREMVLDQFQTGVIYKTTLVIKAPIGGNVNWKFRALPENRFSDGGWDSGANRVYTMGANGAEVTLDPIVPNITPSNPAITKDQYVLFQVTIPANAGTAKEAGTRLPIEKIFFVGLKGALAELGAWAGDWVAADTATGLMVVLNDAGQNGDKVSGDGVWSKLLTIAAGTPGGKAEYKYGAAYEGMESVSASTPMDNEYGFGLNHSFILKESDIITELNDTWLTILTSVEKVDNSIPSSFTLSQNYPNPFNPTTTIQYQLPKEGFVTLKVFNSLGQEVANVVNSTQSAGTYSVTFDPYGLSSGIYFYQLSTNNQTITKKMMFVK
ncbi:MAG: T9SS type A sorting domain-containing protein [Melioribacteraceae bacterium]|nr:T9SS type A sorting domain-containing protein [Melioribacteraceae bacterium]